MKKLIFLLFTCISFWSYAQQFQLTDPKGSIIYTDGQTISATVTEADLDDMGDYIVDVEVHNLTGTVLDVSTVRENIALPAGMLAFVCFGNCDEPTGEQLTMSWPVEEKSMTFFLHVRPSGKTGLCQFKIDFITSAQKMTLFIDIQVGPVGVQEQNNAKVSLSAFPNPAPVNSKVNVSYTLADKSNSNRLVIRNIVGAEVLSLPLNPNDSKISFETSSLLSGIYFYAIESKNQIYIAKKLIVK